MPGTEQKEREGGIRRRLAAWSSEEKYMLLRYNAMKDVYKEEIRVIGKTILSYLENGRSEVYNTMKKEVWGFKMQAKLLVHKAKRDGATADLLYRVQKLADGMQLILEAMQSVQGLPATSFSEPGK